MVKNVRPLWYDEITKPLKVSLANKQRKLMSLANKLQPNERNKMNSLVIVIDGITYVYECNSHSKAMEILAGQYQITKQIDSFELV